MTFELIDFRDLGYGDLVQAVGRTDKGDEFTATGWLSTITNHYGPECYHTDTRTKWIDENGVEVLADTQGAVEVTVHQAGDLKADAKPRAMTKQEIRDYATSLLAAALPPEPVSLI